MALGGAAGASQAGSAGSDCSLPNNGAITGEVHLQSGCVYSQGVVISNSNTTLHCDGAVLDGRGVKPFGVFVNGKGKGISNILVEGCGVRNFTKTGVLVTSGIPQGKLSSDRQVNYGNAPKGVVFKGLVVEGSGGVGVYFNDYVTGSQLKDSVIRGSGGTGIYLEQATRNIEIVNNLIEKNGVSNASPVRREGLAIDSSAGNLIKDNRFFSNAAGGVFLYKNCGEKYSAGNSVIRWQHSNNNTIVGNSFKDQPIGVWLASRQGKDLSHWDCGDVPVSQGSVFYNDYADHNEVKDNKFCGGDVGVRDSGDSNRLLNNKFGGGVKVFVDIPYSDREKPDGKRSVGNVENGSSNLNCN